jgi:hypothetical protein
MILQVNINIVKVAKGCGLKQLIPREVQQKVVKSYVLPWLDYILKGDSSAKSKLDKLLEQDKQSKLVEYKSSCS